MLPIDCHAHTTFSDGALAPAELIDAVRARGVRPTISDHVTRDLQRALRSPFAVRRYLIALESLDVARAGEFCWHDALWRRLPDELASRFTHRIGSLHATVLPGGTLLRLFMPEFPAGLTAEAYMEAHLDSLERLTREMPVDILAHPTLLPRALRERPLEELWTEEREERAVELLARSGIAFEISSRYRPHERFVRRAFERGVRISLGSDGHRREDVGDLSFPLAMAKSIGIPLGDLYDPFVHGARTPPVRRAARLRSGG